MGKSIGVDGGRVPVLKPELRKRPPKKSSPQYCPKCGLICNFRFKTVRTSAGTPYQYWYAVHYDPQSPHSGKECYVGKHAPVEMQPAENYEVRVQRLSMPYRYPNGMPILVTFNEVKVTGQYLLDPTPDAVALASTAAIGEGE